MSTLNDYLASKYGTSTSTSLESTKKKKKKKITNTNIKNGKRSFAIIDEEEMVEEWKKKGSEVDDEDIEPINDTYEIEKERLQKWKPIFAEEERGDEAPLIGLNVGLQTAEKMKKDLDRVNREKREELKRMDPALSGRDAATVYRDKYDIVAQRAEERRKIEEEEKMMKWGKEDQIRKEVELRNRPLTIYKDDVDLNEELKSKERWNDPATTFLTKVSESPPPPPNRFDIPPGYRWDGVDRSNGFEKSYFEKINARATMNSQAYSWSVEDM
ncbi:11079_t:CDS:2 [Diversispora eburnea]|uniref:11079_t:CDS:1 n=1 Tax=Diversispora eburnea TaxID=1213867 RepID=A0A9N8YX84_9GLOM|nr:11079_t:CDS:2 [Diversispora eburnea]